MEPVPSLRDVFASLAGGSSDPAAALSAAGHGDLPSDLVAEAIVNYADAAPVEVAEHLSPFVVPHSAVPQPQEATTDAPDTGDGLALLTDAPTGPDLTPDHEPGHEPGDDPAHEPGHEPGVEGSSVMDAGTEYGVDGQGAEDGSHDTSEASVGHDPADLLFGAGEPDASHVGPLDSSPDAVHPGIEPGHDPAALDPAGPDGGWLDVTSPDVDEVLDEPVHAPHDADATLPSALADEPDDDALHDGAGA